MTISRFFLLSLITALLVLEGCSNKKNHPSVENNINTQKSNVWAFDSLTLKQRIGRVQPDSINSGMEVNLLLEFPTSTPDSIDIIKIQQNICYAFLGSDSIKTTPNEAFNIQSRKLIDGALEEVSAWKEWSKSASPVIDISNFYDSRNTRIKSIISNFMVVSTESYSFLGGAHGSYYISYTNIDINTAKTITDESLYNKNDKEKLSELIQSKIRERNKSTNQDDHIFLLVNIKDIEPNDNFYFSEKGITYVYNQYEIAPYVQGLVEIFLPYADVLPLIKDKYLPSIENIINHSKSK